MGQGREGGGQLQLAGGTGPAALGQPDHALRDGSGHASGKPLLGCLSRCPASHPFALLLPSARSTGYITKDLLKQHMPPPSDDSLVLVCGAFWRPPPLPPAAYWCPLLSPHACCCRPLACAVAAVSLGGYDAVQQLLAAAAAPWAASSLPPLVLCTHHAAAARRPPSDDEGAQLGWLGRGVAGEGRKGKPVCLGCATFYCPDKLHLQNCLL